MTESTPSRQSANRIGQHLKSGLTNYIDHWQEWIVPTLVAGAFVVVSIFCCWFPYLIVVGPVTSGMYAMYIGLIFTMPIMFSIIVSVYDERFKHIAFRGEHE